MGLPAFFATVFSLVGFISAQPNPQSLKEALASADIDSRDPRGQENNMQAGAAIIDLKEQEELFGLPKKLSEIASRVESGSISSEEFAGFLSEEGGAIESKVLRLVNSVFYSSIPGIDSIERAVATLGWNAVTSLTLSLGIIEVTERFESSKGISSETALFWKQTLELALASRLLAERVGYPQKDQAFAAGLLHDIGMIFMQGRFAQEYRQVIEAAETDEDLLEAEKERFGTNHIEVGRWLAESWSLPESFKAVMITPHECIDLVDSGRGTELGSIVALGELISFWRVTNQWRDLEKRLGATERLTTHLGLKESDLDFVTSRILPGVMDLAKNLETEIGDRESLLSQANEKLSKAYLALERLYRGGQELYQEAVEEHRPSAVIESLQIMVATLAHYINNATATISGNVGLLRTSLASGEIDDKADKLEPYLRGIETGTEKILALLEELRKITRLEDLSFDSDSKALDIENLREKVEKLTALKL